MKLYSTKQTNRGITRRDVLMSISLAVLILAILFALLLRLGHPRSSRMECIYNLKQISMALQTLESDNGGEKTPMPRRIPTGPDSGQLVWVDAMGLSNVLHSSKILKCPFDTENPPTNPVFPVRISYFLNLDAYETYPQMIRLGDDNLAIGDGKHPRPLHSAAEGDVPVKPGLLEIATNTTIVWTGTRHVYIGNISFADGSVAAESADGLMNAFQYNFNGTPVTTNRLAIP